MSEERYGAYRVTAAIGAGGISSIGKAVHEPTGRVVAVKALKSQIAATSSFGEQLDREAKLLADLSHPNVVLLLDAGRTSAGRPYLVLEHVEGPSLEHVLGKASKKRKLGVPEALAVACGLCSALEHVHGRGVIHRDVKPSNVLLSREGLVKLVDFGIAQRPRTASLSDTLGTEGITASGRMAPEQLKDAFGTPAYMSPEQILGDFVDGRSDLFSLGVVLFEMLSGSRPYESPGADDSKRSAVQRIRRDAPAQLRERAPHCPRAVERIVMRLLEKSPNERYPSAGVVRERLEAALRAETREEPTTIVRALAAGEKAGAARTPRRNSGLARAYLGFGVIALAFACAAFAIESSSAQAREGQPNESGAASLPLAPERAGGLRVVATPWAYVRVDGQLVETTPFARAIPLSPGKHFVTLAHPEAVSIEREVTIVAGETSMLEVALAVEIDDAGTTGKDAH